MDKLELVEALKCSSKGQLFNKPASFHNSEVLDVFPESGLKQKKVTHAEKKHQCSDLSENDTIYKENKETSENESSEDESFKFDDINNSLDNYNFTDLLLNASNEEIKTKVTNFVTRKQREFERKERELHLESLLKEILLVEEAKQKSLQIEAEEKEQENIYAQHLETKQKQLRESHDRHAKLLDRKNMEARNEMQQREAIKKLQQEKMTEKFNKDVGDIKNEQGLLSRLLSCREIFDRLPPCTRAADELMKQIVDKCACLSEKSELSQDDLNLVSSMSLEAKKIVSIIQKQIGEQILTESNMENQSTNPECKEPTPKMLNQNGSNSRSSLIKEKCSEEYYRLLKVQSETEASLKDINENPEHKDFKRRLTRFIFEPLIALNDHNPELVRQFYHKLCRLFRGETVDLPGGVDRVSLHGHPSAALFCLDRLASKIVACGEKSKPGEQKSLCRLAASIVHSHQSFCDLLFGQLAMKCPFVVPHMEFKGDKTDVEHYKFLGYNLTSGKLEKEDLYLKRMSNMISFYGGVLVAEPIQLERLFGSSASNDTYRSSGMKHAWIWLASFLHQDALEGISATALHSFLVAVGNDLSRCYGRQYLKTILFIKDAYYPRLSEAGQKANATVFNLTDFLQKIRKF